MKKYIIALILIMCTVGVSYATNVLVTAKVGILNSRPIVTSFTPSSSLNTLPSGTGIQTYKIDFTDAEKDRVYYTITAKNGSVNKLNGYIESSSYDTNNKASFNFIYNSPSIKPDPNIVPNETITITLDDGGKDQYKEPRITTHTLNLYIY